MSKLEEFRIFLISNDLPIEPAYRLVTYCPELFDSYSFEDIVMAAPYLAQSLIPVNKTITMPPVVYTAIVLHAMQAGKPIMAHFVEILASEGKELLKKELSAQFNNVHTKLKAL